MIVLDCSAAVEIAEGSAMGRALGGLLLRDEEVVSVDLLPSEAVSVIRKQVLRGEVQREHAGAYLSEAVGLVDRFVPAPDLMQEALAESLRLRHSTYDMLYLVLARRCGGTLFTTDRRLSDLCLENGVNAIADVSL